jgi:hypothetical protein
MRITRCEEWHTLCEVKDANFGDDSCRKIYVVDIITSFLGEEDIGLGELKGFRESGFGSLRIRFG